MATTIKLKNSVTTTNAPSSLVQGEVAINITDKKVWVGNAATTPIQLLGAGASGTFGALTCTSLTDSGLTSGRVTYATTGGLLTDSANLTFNGTTLTSGGYSTGGNLTFTGTGNRITGDFSNATLANRVAFQTSTTNTGTAITVLPNGTATTGQVQLYSNSDPTNASRFSVAAVSTEATIRSDISGTGTYLPLTMYTGGSERLRIDTSGNVGIGTTSPAQLLDVRAATTANIRVGSTGVDLGNGTEIGTLEFFNSDANQNAVAAYVRSIRGSTFGSGGLLTFGTSETGSSAGTVTERMRIDSSGNVGIGTSSPSRKLTVYDTDSNVATIGLRTDGSGTAITDGFDLQFASNNTFLFNRENGYMAFGTNNTERCRITSDGEVLIGTTTTSSSTAGTVLYGTTGASFTRSSGLLLACNRLTNDGTLVSFLQDNTEEGTISVSGTTVSYNGGHLARYAQTTIPKDDSLLKGTILSNLDEMNEYVNAEGNLVPNEQLNKVKVSDVEGDVNVAGVFVNWSHDEAHNVDEINMAMTGDMIIRIAEGVVIQKGDLLMSAGNGTAKPQGDDIVRSKTIAKVTSNHVTCTYADGSYCVPCVLMAC